jgi:putative acetyltransferase
VAITVRFERPDDHDAIREVNRAAFGSDGEANLVDSLREATRIISLVAEDDRLVIGHILFSPIALSGHDDIAAAGLGPLAVSPPRQRGGIGSMLVDAGLDACRQHGFTAVVVIGHPLYYPRFGFRPASQFGLTCEFDVADEVFMAIELEDGVLRNRTGRVSYHSAFSAL